MKLSRDRAEGLDSLLTLFPGGFRGPRTHPREASSQCSSAGCPAPHGKPERSSHVWNRLLLGRKGMEFAASPRLRLGAGISPREDLGPEKLCIWPGVTPGSLAWSRCSVDTGMIQWLHPPVAELRCWPHNQQNGPLSSMASKGLVTSSQSASHALFFASSGT